MDAKKKIMKIHLQQTYSNIFHQVFQCLQDDLIKYKCCNKSYQRNFYEKLNEIFFNKYKFSYHDNNKVILLLWKGVYPYEYIDGREKFNEVSLSGKEYFYSHLDM